MPQAVTYCGPDNKVHRTACTGYDFTPPPGSKLLSVSDISDYEPRRPATTRRSK